MHGHPWLLASFVLIPAVSMLIICADNIGDWLGNRERRAFTRVLQQATERVGNTHKVPSTLPHFVPGNVTAVRNARFGVWIVHISLLMMILGGIATGFIQRNPDGSQFKHRLIDQDGKPFVQCNDFRLKVSIDGGYNWLPAPYAVPLPANATHFSLVCGATGTTNTVSVQDGTAYLSPRD